MMRYLNTTIVGLLLALMASAAWAEALAYRWVDADGVVHFSDQPPPGHIEGQTLSLPEYEPPPRPTAKELRLEARLARLNAYLDSVQEAREEAKLARARAEAAALRAQLVVERNKRPGYRRPIVHGVWFPAFFPHHRRPHPPGNPPMPPTQAAAGSAFDRLFEAKGRIGPGN